MAQPVVSLALLFGCGTERASAPAFHGTGGQTTAGTGGMPSGGGGTPVAGGGGSAGTLVVAGMPSAGGSAGNGGTAAGGGGADGGGGSGGALGAITPPARVLCVGDSITEMAASWIYPLQDAVRQAGCQVTLIGHEASPYNGAYVERDGYDHLRIAAGGFSTSGILNLIDEKGLGGVPDIVLEYLGVNNVYGGFIDGKYNPDNTADPDGSYVRDNTELFSIVRAANPGARFLLMKIQDGLLPEIDAAIDQLVQTESTVASPVLAVDSAVGVETTDGIHPTPAGSETLAGPVSATLVAVLKESGACGN